jgi:hypothetical protein
MDGGKVAFNDGYGVVRLGRVIGERNHPVEDMCGIHQFKITYRKFFVKKTVWVNWWFVWDGSRLNKSIKIII